MELGGRVALVTGAGRRLGRALARALAGRGMTVAIHHHASAAGADELRDEIVAAGGRAACFAADLTDAGRRAPSCRAASPAELGGLDVLVNSAAVMHRLSFEETTPAQYDAILDLNLRVRLLLHPGRGARAPRRARQGGQHGRPGRARALAGLRRPLDQQGRRRDAHPRAGPGAGARGDGQRDRARARCSCRRSTTPRSATGWPGRRRFAGSARPEDAIAALLYLLEGGDFVTGEVLVVDGGRLLR